MSANNEDARAPTILKLTIERFRGIQRLEWWPTSGLNVILGGGDVGKSTILDAIALLFSPTNTSVISDADFWARKPEDEFCIEAIISIAPGTGINQQTKNAWPWHWDGKEAQLPDLEAEGATIPVYRVRVRGTSEFDLAYEVVQPDGNANHFSTAVRRAIGLVRLGGDDRNDRDLRMVQGSALDRLLSDRTLRSRLTDALADTDVQSHLKGDAKKKLDDLDASFKQKALPSDLKLGFTGSQGFTIGALLGLTASKVETQLPLSNWGAGTRRLAALEIAAAQQGELPIVLIDEMERGLEPYRQRMLVADIEGRRSQTFLTTHSAAVLGALSRAQIWYLDAFGKIGALKSSVVAPHQMRDPELFLSRLTIVAEGKTEVGFVRHLLEKNISPAPLNFGLLVADAVGHESALSLLEALAAGGMAFGAFVDNENLHPTRWKSVADKIGPLFFQWSETSTEATIIKLVTAEQLQQLIEDPTGDLTGERLRTLADRIGIAEKSFDAISKAAPNLHDLIIQAATGSIPDSERDADKPRKKALQKHGQCWFKTDDGGRELAAKMATLGILPQLESQLLPFINALRAVLGQSALGSLVA